MHVFYEHCVFRYELRICLFSNRFFYVAIHTYPKLYFWNAFLGLKFHFYVFTHRTDKVVIFSRIFDPKSEEQFDRRIMLISKLYFNLQRIVLAHKHYWETLNRYYIFEYVQLLELKCSNIINRTFNYGLR